RGYGRGGKRWWFDRSTNVTRTGARARARAAESPPKPPPTITTWGRRSSAAGLTAPALRSPLLLRGEAPALVPHADHPGGVLVAEHADRRGAEGEEPSVAGRQPEPARREDPQHVGVGEQRHVAGGGRRAVDDAPGALADLLHRLALGDARRPHRPAGLHGADLRRGPALVDPVVPLAQVVGDLGGVAVSGEAARLPRARQRAREDEGEGPPGEVAAEGLGLLPPALDQRDVGAAGVLTAQAPLGVAVADQPD